jgi:ketosteroid isomerase-like protein
MKTAAQLLQAHLHYLAADFDAWRALYAEHAVMEYPYGGYAGVASPLNGITEISESVKGFLGNVRDFRVTVSNIFHVQGEDAVFAEFKADATVISTGREYHQDYVVYLRAENGKIVFLREYFDAPRVVAAFSEKPE